MFCIVDVEWPGSGFKERVFGVTNSQGNHGEDVKDYYFYLDSTPSHSYMKYLYKYPQEEYPYVDLVNSNQSRSQRHPEYELLDSGVFHDNRYFDVLLEYAKAEAEDILIRISLSNRGPDGASIHLLPTLWCRNTWSWGDGFQERPRMSGTDNVHIDHPRLGQYHCYCDGMPELLYTDNETNHEKLFNSPNQSQYLKDGINDHIVNGKSNAINPDKFGTKVAANYKLTLAAGATVTVNLRLTTKTFETNSAAFNSEFHNTFQVRICEAYEFYRELIPDTATEDQGRMIRQALAGMMWTKQYYEYHVGTWLKEHVQQKLKLRNSQWSHLDNRDIISMPDKWEYPWYATWDLAFHTIALVLVDADFAKQQLMLFLEKRYMHANGQLPAYEWNFSDVNPPVHPFALYSVYSIDKLSRNGKGDFDFLKQGFDKLTRNFNWWVEQKDPSGKSAFEGGFLGLDNIGVFDRSKTLPTGGSLEQSDGNAWMALYAQNMLRIAIELTHHDPGYEEAALDYLEHFINIASAMDKYGYDNDEMWDEKDGFFYDVLRFPDGSGTRLKVRSLVGLLPMCACSVIEADELDALPRFKQRFEDLVKDQAQLTRNISCPIKAGQNGRRLLAILNENKLHRVLTRLLDENEFLAPYGIRSLSRYHQEHPYTFFWDHQQYTVAYLPGESDSGMFGGNSNWRGPIWMPTNFLLLRALILLYSYYGDEFIIEYPSGSGHNLTPYQIAADIARRLSAIFLRHDSGRRPVYGSSETFQNDEHWRDLILFYEYFHGDDGTGLGASHQTGWTGLIATIEILFASLDLSNW